MSRIAKLEPLDAPESSVGRRRERTEDESSRLFETPKRQRVDGGNCSDLALLDGTDRRGLRSRYLAVNNIINDEKDELSSSDSQKFSAIFSTVENLHQLVQKPREQVADAEALLNITNTLVSSVICLSNGGIGPSNFVACLRREFGSVVRMENNNYHKSILWRDIGLAVSPLFMKCQGCDTMVGPMYKELKTRKVGAYRRGTRSERNGDSVLLSQRSRPEKVNDGSTQEKEQSDKRMSTMFDVLKREKTVKLERLILNRQSFAQTVENLFALSFLVKDGRVEIKLDEMGCHLVSARNAPDAHLIMSHEVSYSHFAFRFDFKDWQIMVDAVPKGEEFMSHRGLSELHIQGVSQKDPVINSQAFSPTMFDSVPRRN